MGGQFVPHMAAGPRPMGAMQQMMNQVSQPMIRQQMGIGGRMPGMPGHPAVTAGLRLTIPQQQMGPGAPGTPNSALPSPALTPRSEHDDMDTRSSGAHTPGSDKMDGSITPDMNDPNKALKRRPSAQMPGQKRRISANDVVGAKKRPRKGSRVDDGDYDNYIDTVMHQLKNLPPMSTVEPKLSHSFNACGVYGIGDVPKLMSKDIDIHSGPLEGKFGNSSLSTEGDYYSTMPFGPEPPVPYIPPVSCSQRGFYQQEFMPDIRPEAPCMDGYVSPDLFYSSSPEPDAEEERINKKKRKERRKAAMIKEKADAKKLAEERKEKEEAEKENQEKTEGKEGSDIKDAIETENKKEQAEVADKKESSDKKDESDKKETSSEKETSDKKQVPDEKETTVKESSDKSEAKKESDDIVIKKEEGTTVSEETPSKDSNKTNLEKENMEVEKEAKVEEEEEEEEECISPYLDLWPDDSDDEPAVVEPPPPPKISSRPPSPEMQLLRPIPIKPKPGQTITLSDLTNLDKKREEKENVKKLDARLGLLSLAGSLGITPKAFKEKDENVSNVTVSLSGSGSSKSVLKALKGLSKLLEIDTPKHWLQSDQKTTRALYRVKREGGKDGPPLDLQAVMNRNAKVCRECDVVIQHDMIKKKSADLPFLSKNEKEESSEDVFFCDSDCYFNFAIKKTGGKTPEKVTNLKQLEEFQKKHKEESDVGGDTPKKEARKGPRFKGTHYKTYSSTLCIQRKQKIMNEKDLTQMMFQMGITMMPPREAEDTRTCLFCHMRGDAAADGPARLLNYEVDKWVHLNCALWSEEVYETVSGALVNCETALKNGSNNFCEACEKPYATIKCFKTRCTNIYHLGCAVKEKATFYKNKTVFCKDHQLKGEKDNELTTLAVYRRVYIERDENRQVASVMASGMETHNLRVGSLTFLSVGQLLPHQLRNFHSEEYIYPIGYKILRYYWSMRNPNKRCNYFCSVEDNDNKPEFVIEVSEAGHEAVTFKDDSCRGVWMKVLTEVEKTRKTAACTKVFPDFINGEDLFGFLEPNVVKVVESLPGVESLPDYNFKYGRNPMLELPLAVNPSGCARSEPKLQTHVKRIHNFQRTGATKDKLHRDSKEMVPFLVGLETIGPYSKNFVQSKASQYRKMKQEWRQNVLLARSKIAGLGLYAARDLERGQMIIEYIGEVIRGNLTDIREKRYESQNRGIYMFRLDDDRVVDATLTGGVARYINHCCEPNCVTETVELADWHIIIFANRRINRGEELSYDYKFDFEDDNRIPCLCGAKNCRKWMN